MNRGMRDFLSVFAELDLKVIDVRVTGSNHYKFTAECGGERKYFVSPSSSSDVRAIHNFKSEVKRWQRSILS